MTGGPIGSQPIGGLPIGGTPAEAEAEAPKLFWSGWQGPVIRKAVLATAVVASTVLVWTPPVPAAAADSYGFQNARHIYSPAKRSVALLGSVAWPAQAPTEAAAYTYVSDNKIHRYSPAQRSTALLGQIAAKPDQPPQPSPKGWASAFTQPAKRFVRVPTYQGGFFKIGEDVVITAPQEGWRSTFTNPPKLPARSAALLGSVAWAPQVPAVEPVYTYVADNKRHLYSPAKRSTNLLGGPVWAAKVPTVEAAAPVYGFSNQVHRYDPARRSVGLLNSPVWPAQTPAVVQVTYQDGWRSQFSQPIKRFRLPLQPGGWAARVPDVVVVTYQEGWRNKFQEPPQRPRRSVALLGQPIWAPQVPTAEAQVNYVADNKRHLYSPAKRSVNLLGGPVWPARVPTVEVVITYGFQNAVTKWPYEYVQARRSRDFLGPSVTWPPQIVPPSPEVVVPPEGGAFYPTDAELAALRESQRKYHKQVKEQQEKVERKAREIERTIVEAYEAATGKPRLRKALKDLQEPSEFTPETIILIGQDIAQRLVLALEGTGRHFASDRRRVEELLRGLLELESLVLDLQRQEEDDMAALLLLTTVM